MKRDDQGLCSNDLCDLEKGAKLLQDPLTHIHDIRVTWGDFDPARIACTGRLPWFALDAINAW